MKGWAAGKTLDHLRFIQIDLLCNAPCPKNWELQTEDILF